MAKLKDKDSQQKLMNIGCEKTLIVYGIETEFQQTF